MVYYAIRSYCSSNVMLMYLESLLKWSWHVTGMEWAAWFSISFLNLILNNSGRYYRMGSFIFNKRILPQKDVAVKTQIIPLHFLISGDLGVEEKWVSGVESHGFLGGLCDSSSSTWKQKNKRSLRIRLAFGKAVFFLTSKWVGFRKGAQEVFWVSRHHMNNSD